MVDTHSFRLQIYLGMELWLMTCFLRKLPEGLAGLCLATNAEATEQL